MSSFAPFDSIGAQIMWTWVLPLLCIAASASAQTTTTTTSTTQLGCVGSLYQGPILNKKGRPKFELFASDGQSVNECAALCEANVDCVGFSHKAGEIFCCVLCTRVR
jgi:hypothetical protein